MKKVVAFLEKYAEWLALGVACLFLLFTIYTYIVSPDALKVKVGNEAMLPGDVDPYSATAAVRGRSLLWAGRSAANRGHTPDGATCSNNTSSTPKTMVSSCR